MFIGAGRDVHHFCFIRFCEVILKPESRVFNIRVACWFKASGFLCERLEDGARRAENDRLQSFTHIKLQKGQPNVEKYSIVDSWIICVQVEGTTALIAFP